MLQETKFHVHLSFVRGLAQSFGSSVLEIPAFYLLLVMVNSISEFNREIYACNFCKYYQVTLTCYFRSY